MIPNRIIPRVQGKGFSQDRGRKSEGIKESLTDFFQQFIVREE